MKKLWPIVLLMLGIMIICGGFTYDIMFAGIPFQDPPPELLASYTMHANIAATIRLIGSVVFALGIIGGVVVLIRRRPQNE